MKPTVLLAALVLAGCSNIAPVRSVGDALGAQRVGEAPAAPVSQRHPQIRVRLNERGEGVMVLGRVQDGVQLWLAVDGKTLLVDASGHVVGTRGFRRDLVAHQWLGPAPDFRDLLSGETDELVAHRHLHFRGAGYDQISLVHARYRLSGGPTPIRFGEKAVQVQQVHATVRDIHRDQATQYRFWIRPDDGSVMLTLQQLSPEVPLLRLEAIR